MIEQKMTTEQRKTLFLTAYVDKYKFNISAACREAGISRATFYVWLKNDEDFYNKFSDIQDGFIDKAEEMFYKQVESEQAEFHWKAIKQALKSKRAKGRDFAEAEPTPQHGNSGTTIVITTAVPRPKAIKGEVIEIVPEQLEDKREEE